MKLLLVTDAWDPQVNGVVTTYKSVIRELKKTGVETEIIHPGLFKSISCPGYAEIPLVLNIWAVGKAIKATRADYIHIAVEGPLGIAARTYLTRRNIPFTTSFHTRFPEYINKRFPFISLKLGYRFMHWFHAPSKKIMVTTPSMERVLMEHKFSNMQVWGRGVNTDLFKPDGKQENSVETPIFLYVGRIAVEKSVEDFLRLELPGKKVIVGDGPSRATLEGKYPDAEFVGYKHGRELANYFAKADVFVFPSKTDTFGLVMLEAMACGTPVAAYPVPGPIDVVQPGVTGVLDNDLRKAALSAIKLNRSDCRDYALQSSWQVCADRLRQSLVAAKR